MHLSDALLFIYFFTFDRLQENGGGERNVGKMAWENI
jgi:hypothetical protein